MAEFYGRVQQEPFTREWVARCWPSTWPKESCVASNAFTETKANDRQTAVVNLQHQLTDIYGQGNTIVFPDLASKTRRTLAEPEDSLCLNCGNAVSFQYAEQIWVHRYGYKRRCPDVSQVHVKTDSGEVVMCTIDWDQHTYRWSLFPKGTKLGEV